MDYDARQAVHLPVTDYLKLDLYLMDTRPGVKLDAFVTDLVNRWLAVEMERSDLRARGQAMRGFQWKNVFLPEGTALRTSYCDTVEFAKVVGNKIVSDDGVHMTPSQFANRHAKGRNAWRFLWLRFPGNDYWIRAGTYRLRDGERSLASLKRLSEQSNSV